MCTTPLPVGSGAQRAQRQTLVTAAVGSGGAQRAHLACSGGAAARGHDAPTTPAPPARADFGDVKNIYMNLDRRTGFVKGWASLPRRPRPACRELGGRAPPWQAAAGGRRRPTGPAGSSCRLLCMLATAGMTGVAGVNRPQLRRRPAGMHLWSIALSRRRRQRSTRWMARSCSRRCVCVGCACAGRGERRGGPAGDGRCGASTTCSGRWAPLQSLPAHRLAVAWSSSGPRLTSPG